MKKKLIFFGIIICIIIGYIFIKVSNNYEPLKSIESRVKSTIFQMRNQAEFVFQKNSPGSYENLCSEDGTKSLLSRLDKKSLKCFGDFDSWIVVSNLKDNNSQRYYCSDSKGISQEINEIQYQDIKDANTLCLGGQETENDSDLDIDLIKKNTFICNKEIIPELKKFENEYTGGGNSGTAVPDSIFFKCLEKKMNITQEIIDYIRQNSQSITPPFLE
jgi:hypothetical protein